MKGQSRLKQLLQQFVKVVEDTQFDERDAKLQQLAREAKRLLGTQT